MAKVTVISGNAEPVAVQGRLDILLLRLAEAGTRWAERRAQELLRVPVNLWDGSNGVGAVLGQKLNEWNVPNEPLTPALMAERVGFMGKRARKLTKVG